MRMWMPSSCRARHVASDGRPVTQLPVLAPAKKAFVFGNSLVFAAVNIMNIQNK